MWNYIKIELRRGFWNRNMLWALLAVLLISFGQIALDVFPMLQYLKPITADTPAKEILFPHTVFEKGLCFNRSSSLTYYFYMILPIFCALPFGGVLFHDWKKGYTKNVFTKTPKVNYYVSQYVAAFLTAGVISLVPAVINTLVTALLLPSTLPYPGIGYVGIFSDSLLASVYYTNPYLYLLIYLIIDFVLFGLLNTMALSFSYYLKSEFSVVMFPFLIFQFLYFFGVFLKVGNWSLFAVTIPTQPDVNVSWITIVAYLILMLLIDVFAIWKYVQRKDHYE